MAGIVNAPVLGINFKQNTNSQSSGYGKYYPEVDRQKTLSTRGFAEHIISHGSKYGLEDIVAILRMFSTCLPELLAMGIGVKFDGLGIFLPYAESKKGITKQQMASVSPRDVVKAVHIRFQPDSTKLDDLSGPAFADRCSLELRNVVLLTTIKEGNKVVERLRTLVPIETFLSENYNGPTSGGTSGNGGSGENTNPTNPTNGGTEGGDDNGGGGDDNGGGDNGDDY